MIKKCTCAHKFQDKTYGKGKRVMNSMHKRRPGKGGWGKVVSFRCTVCEAVKPV